MEFGKIRPQIFVAIVILGVLGIIGIFQDMNEIATACVSGIGILGMKLLEGE